MKKPEVVGAVVTAAVAVEGEEGKGLDREDVDGRDGG